MISCRRKAREVVLQALFQCDALSDWSSENIDLYFRQFQKQNMSNTEKQDSNQFDENRIFADTLINGVIANREYIDAQISSASKHWSVSRMSRVDRNLIRQAVYEIIFCDDIPISVTINEAIELAKRYSSDDAPHFINGVLDHIAHIFQSDPRAQKKTAGSGPTKNRVVNY